MVDTICLGGSRVRYFEHVLGIFVSFMLLLVSVIHFFLKETVFTCFSSVILPSMMSAAYSIGIKV